MADDRPVSRHRLKEMAERLARSLPAEFDSADLQPARVATLLRLCRTAPVESAPLRRVMQERLLDLTVRRAVADAPFYRERLAGWTARDVSSGSADRLDTLPILERADAEAAGDGIHSQCATYAFTSYTSGTTTGRPLLVDRCLEEQSFLAALFTNLRAGSGASRLPIVLVLTSGDHGRGLQIPGAGYSVPVSLDHPRGLDQALALLRRTYRIGGESRRVSSVAGGPTALEVLADMVARQGDEGLTDSVELLQAGGHYCSRERIKRLTTRWSCPMTDTFSLTELFFTASRCPYCDLYHFNDLGVAELVGLDSDESIVEGRGRLVLTGLFPFTQMTPLIRYATGDLAERKIVSCPYGTIGYRLLGRIQTSVDVTSMLGRSAFVARGDVVEALEPLPYLQNLDSAGWSYEPGGAPYFTLRRDDLEGHLAVSVVVRDFVRLGPAGRRKLTDAAATQLAAAGGPLRDLMSEGRVRVEFSARQLP